VGAVEFVAVNGTRIAYRQQGDGEPVLLLHPGFVADGMLPLFPEQALSGFRLIAYHRRGYGDSDRVSGPMPMTQQAEDTLTLLDALGVGRVHLVGASFGGDVALEIGVRAPQRVGSLVLLEPLLGFALSPESARFIDETARAALPRFQAGDAADAVEIWLTSAFGHGFRDVMERRLPGSWERAGEDAGTAFGVELPALQGWSVGPDDLTRLRVPTLSVVHTPDPWPGFEETHAFLLAQIPGSEGAVLQVASHLLQILDPSAVAEVVASFLRRHALDLDRTGS
jgi:pimeloyl-ACP methyl ester carboxylesterase